MRGRTVVRRGFVALVAATLALAGCEFLPDETHNGGEILPVPVSVEQGLDLRIAPVTAGAGRTWVITHELHQAWGDVAIRRLLPGGAVDRSIGVDGTISVSVSDAELVDAVGTPDGGLVFVTAAWASSRIWKVTSSGQVTSTYGGVPASDTAPPGGLEVDPAGGVIVGNISDTGFHTVRIGPDGTQDLAYGVDGVLAWPNQVEFGQFAAGAGGHASASGTDVAWISPAGETAATPAGIGPVALVAADDDGRVVAAGAPQGGSVPVARLGADRTVDGSFGAGGVAMAPVPAPGAILRAVVPLADDSVALSWSLDAPRSVMATRLTAAGAPDAGFGGSGRILIDGSAGSSPVGRAPWAQRLDRVDDRLVGALTSPFTAGIDGTNGELVAFTATTGALDGGFGEGGVVGSVWSPLARVDVVLALADGSTLVGGGYGDRYSSKEYGWRYRYARVTPEGVIDTAYGIDGLSEAVPGIPVAVWGDRVVVRVRAHGGRPQEPYGFTEGPQVNGLMLLDADGRIVDDFGGDGFVEAEVGPTALPDDIEAFNVGVVGDSVVATTTGTVAAYPDPGSFVQRVTVARYGPDGQLLATADASDVLDDGYVNGSPVFVAADGDRPVVVGITCDAPKGTAEQCGATARRLLPDLGPDPTWAGGGTARRAGFQRVSRAAAGPGGSVMVGGSGGTTRFLSDGSVDHDYGTDGVAVVRLDGTYTIETAVIEPDGKVTGVGHRDRYQYPSIYPDGAVVYRLNADGDLDTTAHTGGVRYWDVSAVPAWYSVVITPDGHTVVSDKTGILRLNG